MLTLNRKDKQRVFKKDRFDQVLFKPIIFYRPRRIEYYSIPMMLFNRFTKRLKRRTEKALKKRKKEKGSVMKFQILDRRFWRVQLQRCKYKSDSWH